MSKVHFYFRSPPPQNRFLPGDRFILPPLRKLLKGTRVSGVEKVFINLCKGFDILKLDYDINLQFEKIKPNEPVVVLGNGKYALEGYQQSNPVIAGISLMTHPSQWPNLLQDYPVAKYLQHSEWANNVYIPYFGSDVCQQWPAGIETDKWAPADNPEKKVDFLIYDKIMWDHEQRNTELKAPIINKINELGLTYRAITYGNYKEVDYLNLLNECKAMIFLCEHESQGFACCEALSMNVPVLAWDQGLCLDPNRFAWNDPVIKTTSIPFFDERCGQSFKDFNEFNDVITSFWNNVIQDAFKPREYILEHLTLQKSAERMLEIIDSVYK
jgi:hypothetical protein